MNKRQLQIQKIYLNNEKAVIKELKHSYAQTLAEIGDKIKILQSGEMTQAKMYQLQYQLSLRTQVSQILDKMKSSNFNTVQDYLKNCYQEGFIGTLYDLQGQGIPLVFPMNQQQIVKAIQLDSPISQGMYKRMGMNVELLKKKISDEITRGIAGEWSYQEIARNLKFYGDIDYNKSIRIARTEGHRIQQASTLDCQLKAKENGADIKKQWDATLDDVTREEHAKLDGQIVDVDEPFEVDGYSPMYPSDFGDPAQDCNCRCCLLQRASWNLDDYNATKFDNSKAERSDVSLVKFDDKNYKSFKESYFDWYDLN